MHLSQVKWIPIKLIKTPVDYEDAIVISLTCAKLSKQQHRGGFTLTGKMQFLLFLYSTRHLPAYCFLTGVLTSRPHRLRNLDCYPSRVDMAWLELACQTGNDIKLWHWNFSISLFSLLHTAVKLKWSWWDGRILAHILVISMLTIGGGRWSGSAKHAFAAAINTSKSSCVTETQH